MKVRDPLWLSHDEIKRRLDYDPETGVFRWRIRASRRMDVGSLAGCTNPSGYHYIVLRGPSDPVRGRLHTAHRLAFFYMTGRWPRAQIDHINNIKADNRWHNLREATPSLNSANRPYRPGKTGIQGVTFYKGRYIARVSKDRHRIHIGLFKSAESAGAAYRAKRKELYGEYAMGA